MSVPAVRITIVHEAELRSPRQHGRRIRAYCPVHGGDNQRSLSIEAAGEHAGYGYCHNGDCHAVVFVPELNPEEAARRERGEGRAYTPRRITPAAMLRPVPRQMPAHEPTPEAWQRAELEALTRWYPRMRQRLEDDRARAYLEARGIPWEIADGAGVGYVPADARLGGSLAKWRDRLIFPLGSPAGTGYAGRSLWGWRLGMDENEHKAMLEADPEAPRRWEKTYPAGWLGYGALANVPAVVLVEGPLDALALMTAGLVGDVPVVALVGTAGRAEWIPDTVAGAVLALDGDGPGRKAAAELAYNLHIAGLPVVKCAPPLEDGRGKDWAERWRLAEWEGVAPVFDALDALAGPGDVVTPAEIVAPTPEPETGAGASLDALARADAVVCYLLAHGLELIDVCPAPPVAATADVRQSLWLPAGC